VPEKAPRHSRARTEPFRRGRRLHEGKSQSPRPGSTIGLGACQSMDAVRTWCFSLISTEFLGSKVVRWASERSIASRVAAEQDQEKSLLRKPRVLAGRFRRVRLRQVEKIEKTSETTSPSCKKFILRNERATLSATLKPSRFWTWFW
jgi:hypothetical protein